MKLFSYVFYAHEKCKTELTMSCAMEEAYYIIIIYYHELSHYNL